jgi:preprotein translocase subunit SecY
MVGFIPGVKPGEDTASYLDQLVSRITLPGSIFLGLIAVIPAFAKFQVLQMDLLCSLVVHHFNYGCCCIGYIATN